MTQLETELRAALQARATRVHASQGLLAADYRRTRRIRPPLASARVSRLSGPHLQRY